MRTAVAMIHSAKGMNAGELARFLPELGQRLAGGLVRDVLRLRAHDDLVLFLSCGDHAAALHIVPGAPRGRVCRTPRRFTREEHARGPQVQVLRSALEGATLASLQAVPGERQARILLQGSVGTTLRLQVELFGPRGLWCLCDAEDRILAMSRPFQSKARVLRLGDTYLPPPPRPAPAPAEPPIEGELEQLERELFERDMACERDASRLELERALQRAERKLQTKIAGLRVQAESMADAATLRQRADLMLAHAKSVTRGDAVMEVPDPRDESVKITIRLDPAKPLPAQANALYRKARKLEDGLPSCQARQAEANAQALALAKLQADLAACETEEELLRLRSRLVAAGHLPPPPSTRPDRLAKITKGQSFRRFHSAEGHLVMVGRSNAQNDTLSLRVARGNDLWFHVGEGLAGSHVVVRLPRGKTPSLETLLDAATLAVHFSKARQRATCQVTYTLAKYVRKPKGLPPGRVTVSGEKTLSVRLAPDRLRRLLESGE